MISRTSIRVAAFAAAAGLLGVACGASSDDAVATPAEQSESAADPTSETSTASDAEPTPAANADAPQILQFTNALVGGGELDASTLGDKTTAFWFWAPT